MQALRVTVGRGARKSVISCKSHSCKFGFKREMGCTKALIAIATVLIDAESSGESLPLVGPDIRHVFDSLIDAAMPLKARKRRLNLAVVRSLWFLYSRLQIRQKLPNDKGLFPIPCTRSIPVKKRARQLAVTSPVSFSFCVLLSLVNYSDNIINVS